MEELQIVELIQNLIRVGITKPAEISIVSRKKGSGRPRKLIVNDARALIHLA